MAILAIGLILFLGAHSLRLLAPVWHDRTIARVGESRFKGIASLASLIGLVLLVWGFARASSEPEFLYLPPGWARHLTATLMLPALVLFAAGNLPTGYIKRSLGYPMLIGTALWAFAHLFVNGDVAGFVLFGALLVWSLADLLSQRDRPPAAPVTPAVRSDVIAVIVGVVLYGLLVWRLHFWLFGVSPLG